MSVKMDRKAAATSTETKVKLPELFQRASVNPKSFDEEARTVEVVFSAGTRGRRFDFFVGEYFEELEISKKALRLDRFKKGAPVLADHRASLEHVIGVIETAKIDKDDEGNRIGIATVRFAKDERSEEIFRKVSDGIITKVSVGYLVHKYEEVDEDTKEERGGVPVYRAVDWEPMELSFVAVPFDNEAAVRSERKAEAVNECTIVNREGVEMKTREEENKEAVEAPAAEESKKEESQETKTEESKEESPKESAGDAKEDAGSAPASEESSPSAEERSAKIVSACKRASLDLDFAESLIKSTRTFEEAKDKIINELSKRSANTMTNGRGPTVEAGSYDEASVARDGMIDAIMHRYDPSRNKLSEKGRIFRGRTLWELSERILKLHGEKTDGMSRSEIVARSLGRDFNMKVRFGMNGTTDFPEILANVANKTLRQAYEMSPQTFRPWTRQSTSPDFKEVSRTQLGEAPKLKKITEHGEFTYGSMGEMAEKYALATYGRIFPITRQAIINDDLQAFTRAPAALGRSAANLESDLVYEILISNPNMADSNALFSSQHGNLGTAGTISETTLNEMRKLGRLQKGIPQGQGETGEYLNVMHKYLIVGPDLETKAQKELGLVQPNAPADVNPFASLYQLLVEPRLDVLGNGKSWFGAAEPVAIDTIEYAYLEGQESVFIESDVDFDTDGVRIKARHDFAAKAIDWRGLFKNPFTG